MKQIIFYFSTIFIISCNTSQQHEVAIEMGDNKSSQSILMCDCDSLILNADNQLTFENKIYTGNCFINYPNGTQKYIEKQILDGFIHGKITYFDKQGSVLFNETYNEGKLMGSVEDNIHCNCTDLEIKETSGIKKNYLNKSLFSGSCEDYFPNSEQIYLEANYKNGLLDGYTIYYQKDGSVLIMQDYKEGILIEDIAIQ